MREWLHNGFAQPWALALLFLPTVMVIYNLWRERRRQRALEDLAGIPGLVADPAGRRRVRLWLWLFAVNFLALGIAGPLWGRDASAPPSQGRDLMIVLDVSRSMLAEDPKYRLERARTNLYELADTLQRKGGFRVGLIAFAGKAKLLCPLTEDIEHFRYAVSTAHPDRLGPGGRLDSPSEEETTAYGTWLRRALEKAVQTHEQQYRGFQSILLVSDGDDQLDDALQGAAAAKDAGIPVYVLGIGDSVHPHFIPTGNDSDPFVTEEDGATKQRRKVRTLRRDALLREIADATDGLYYPEDPSGYPLVSWFENRIATLPPRELVEDQRMLQVQRSGWFFGGALALLLLELIFAHAPRRIR